MSSINGIYSMTREEMHRQYQQDQLARIAVGFEPLGAINVDMFDNKESSIARAYEILGNLSHAAEMAVGSALKYAAKRGENYGASAVKKDYFISSYNFKRYTRIKNRYGVRSGEMRAEIYYMGEHIPLIYFNTHINKNGLIQVRVKRSSKATVLSHVFSQQVGKKHLGLYERVTKARYPIEEKFGPSVPQMMYSNEDVAEKISEMASEAFEKRLDHEINSILNGNRIVSETLRQEWYG